MQMSIGCLRINRIRDMILNDDIRLIDLTVGQLRALLSEASPRVEARADDDGEMVYGLRGLAELLGVSLSTAQSLRNSGRIKSATVQSGRKLAFRKHKVLDILSRR